MPEQANVIQAFLMQTLFPGDSRLAFKTTHDKDRKDGSAVKRKHCSFRGPVIVSVSQKHL